MEIACKVERPGSHTFLSENARLRWMPPGSLEAVPRAGSKRIRVRSSKLVLEGEDDGHKM